MRVVLIILTLVMVSACAPTRYYKPLDKGEHALSGTLGGPLINVPGVAPMPIPFTTLGYGYGVTDDLTAYANWHSTSAAFGVFQMDIGSSFRFWQNERMGVSIAPTFNLLIDRFDADFRWYPQLDLNYYFEYGSTDEKSNDIYAGFDNWFDPQSQLAHGQPNTNRWLWNTHFGHTFNRNKWSYQLELKVLAPYINNNVVVDYISPFGDQGGIGFYFGITRRF